MADLHSSSISGEPTWVSEVLHFWFEELGAPHWFTASAQTDAQIHDRFHELHRELVAHHGGTEPTPRSVLAAVIVLDQFSRNLFRGSPQAFAADGDARVLSRLAISRGFDRAMNEQERMFLYLPFEHSEAREDQALAVELISRLGNEEWTRHAVAHQAIIDRFGRFPQRNAVLDRSSSEEEVALLRQPATW